MTVLHPLLAISPDQVEALLDRAFGPGRFARTAYAIRGGVEALPALSFAAMEGDTLIGSVQCWPVVLALDAGGIVPLVMVGPVAVDPERQQAGLGRLLMSAALGAAAQAGCDDRLMLIGDPEYYGRFFDFSADRTGQWRLPGPVERRRLLARGAGVPDAPGLLGPAASAFTPPLPTLTSAGHADGVA